MLRVSRQTLYAYVSRGRIGVTAAPDEPRRSLYDATDVRRLAERSRTGRSRSAVAASTISWGEPILASAISRIEGGRLEYRGRDAIALAETATLEDVAALAMAAVDALPRADAPPPAWPRAHRRPAPPTLHAAMADLATAGRWTGRVDGVLPDAVRILDRIAWAAAGLPGSDVGVCTRPMHQRLAATWGVGAKAADMIRRALVLIADHELNTSTYATRVVASTRAPLGACILAGLAALVGPLHGGMTNEVRALLAEPGVMADPGGGSGGPAGTRRADPGVRPPAVSGRRSAGRGAAVPPGIRGTPERLVEAMQAMTGIQPNIDFALVMVEQRLRLPTGAAFALFAVGRAVGWIAHALEQWRYGTLIRPRAVYPVG